jgi:uncharacterized membrane protein YqjE
MAYPENDSVSGLVRGALDDMRDLVREELALARVELRQEMSKAMAAGVQFGVAGVSLWFAATFLLVAMALGISALFGWPAWAGFGIVAALLAIAGAVFLGNGRRAIRTVQPLPHTVHSIKENFR